MRSAWHSASSHAHWLYFSASTSQLIVTSNALPHPIRRTVGFVKHRLQAFVSPILSKCGKPPETDCRMAATAMEWNVESTQMIREK
jgi:hypothetical protein